MIREILGTEMFFMQPTFQENIIMGIKYSNSKCVQKAVSNFQKIFSGLRLKMVNDKFYRMEEDVPLVKLPDWIQDTRFASDYVFEHHTLPVDKGLATIAYNDRLVVVNSNHALNDGGFILQAIKRSLDDDISKDIKFGNTSSTTDKLVDPPFLIGDVFNDEIESSIKRFDPKKNLESYQNLNFCEYDPNDKHLAPLGTQPLRFKCVIPANELGCYDSKAKKPKSLSETTWSAIAFSLAAFSNTVLLPCDHRRYPKYELYQPLGCSSVLDIRRFTQNPEKVTWRNGNLLAQPAMIAIPQKNDTIADINRKLRNSLNKVGHDGAFYSAKYFSEMFTARPFTFFGGDSSLGPIKIKNPILDVDIMDYIRTTNTKDGKKTGDRGEINGTQFTTISYSVVSENRNEYHLMSRLFPYQMSMAASKVLFGSVCHFLKTFPLSSKYEDVFDELKEFQRKMYNEI